MCCVWVRKAPLREVSPLFFRWPTCSLTIQAWSCQARHQGYEQALDLYLTQKGRSGPRSGSNILVEMTVFLSLPRFPREKNQRPLDNSIVFRMSYSIFELEEKHSCIERPARFSCKVEASFCQIRFLLSDFQ